MKEKLTIEKLIKEAVDFCKIESKINQKDLIGITDGKAVGTYVEHKLKNYLLLRYDFKVGNSASGIDLPDEFINTDIKVTSIKQPQSSCPFKSSRQKIFGLGYNLLILVYDKIDQNGESYLNFLYCTFVTKERTADYSTTKRLKEMLKDNVIKEDVIAYLYDRNIPGDEITYDMLADEIMKNNFEIGYLTISNALQWRLQYARVIHLNNEINGVENYEINKN